MHVSIAPLGGEDVAHRACVDAAPYPSSSEMICIARTFGAPETVPAGKHARSSSKGVTPSRSSPTTSETRWVTCE